MPSTISKPFANYIYMGSDNGVRSIPSRFMVCEFYVLHQNSADTGSEFGFTVVVRYLLQG